MRCIDWCLPLPAGGACKAVEQEEEEEEEPAVATGPSGPVSPPLLPNAFHIPGSPQTPGTPVTPSAPSPVEGPGNSECVVCMETGVRILQRNHQQARDFELVDFHFLAQSSSSEYSDVNPAVVLTTLVLVSVFRLR